MLGLNIRMAYLVKCEVSQGGLPVREIDNVSTLTVWADGKGPALDDLEDLGAHEAPVAHLGSLDSAGE